MKEDKKNNYTPFEIEKKWQAKWLENSVYQPDLDTAKNPFFNLMMFPYPSAEGMHVGNMYAFTGSDIYGRYKRMRGYDVFEPIGLDGFGIHSENYAIKVGNHPVDQAKKSQENFYRQLRATGNGFDWSRTVETYDPKYYKWTQWLFITLFKAGLAYRKKAPVNFCPSCKTVLADEQVIDGKCERCSSEVERRELEQWFFRITTYAERLLNNLEKMEWTEKVKIAQRNWIGKKTGINITYKVESSNEKIVCFTTRPDTNFGATFIVVGPEYANIEAITAGDRKKEVLDYVQKTKKISENERNKLGRKKTGVFTGSYAINNLNGKRLPVWVSDFVIGNVGTGAVVGVPGHDLRDFQFAKEFDLPVIRVVVSSDKDTSIIERPEQVQEKEGTMVNSDFLDGLDILEAKEKIMDYLVHKGFGEKVTTYHLRDWLISRQRYWGPPIPMIYCESCSKKGLSWFTTEEAKEESKISNFKFQISNYAADVAGWYPVPDDQLPVELPVISDFKPLGTGQAPLANHPEFYKTSCPKCGSDARRETDVSDTFLDSAWYFLRYISTELNDMPFPMEDNIISRYKDIKKKENLTHISISQYPNISDRTKNWLPVAMYIGGAEHSVLHLLYSRFVTMVLHDLALIAQFEEPFSRFYAHGLLIKEGAKMSKSKGNVIVPDEYIRKYGADTLRTYLMFLGPFSAGGDFYDSGIEGIYKFLKRVWVLFKNKKGEDKVLPVKDKTALNKIIKQITDDMENLRYNTAIAKLMSFYNYLSKKETCYNEELTAFLKMLAPFSPHVTEELWQNVLNNKRENKNLDEFQSIHHQSWPQFNPKITQEAEITLAVQINGKTRDIITIHSIQLNNQSDIEKKVKQLQNIKKYIQGKNIKKVIYVPGKIINFVI